MSQQFLYLHQTQSWSKETALVLSKAGICFSALPMIQTGSFFFFFSFWKGSWQRMFAGG